jgi:hypothetical protein
MATDYTALDAAILEHLRSRSPVHPMYARACEELARLASASEPFRTIDRRLQALRKAGRIRFVGVMEPRGAVGERMVRRWIIVEEPQQ